jgi:hypothetical protein
MYSWRRSTRSSPASRSGRGDYAGLVRAIESGSFTDLGDCVERLGLLFLVHHREGQADEPPSAADLRALCQPQLVAGTRSLLTTPSGIHVRERPHRERLNEGRGGCLVCIAHTRSAFSDPGEALTLARTELAGESSRAVSDGDDGEGPLAEEVSSRSRPA